MKHFVEGFKSIKNGDASGNLTGNHLKCILLDYAIAFVEWTGTAAGTLTFEVSMSSESGDVKYYTLDDVTYSIVSGGGNVEINLERLCHGLIRPVFTHTSGTGSLNVTINGKSIGA
jgi:hypothetical protein